MISTTIPWNQNTKRRTNQTTIKSRFLSPFDLDHSNFHTDLKLIIDESLIFANQLERLFLHLWPSNLHWFVQFCIIFKILLFVELWTNINWPENILNIPIQLVPSWWAQFTYFRNCTSRTIFCLCTAMRIETFSCEIVCRSTVDFLVILLSFCNWILQQVLIRSLQFCAGYLALYIVLNICYFQDSKSAFLLFISLVEVGHNLFPLWWAQSWNKALPNIPFDSWPHVHLPL